MTQYTRYLGDRAGHPASHQHRGAGGQRRPAAELLRRRLDNTRIFTLIVIVLVMTAGAAW